MKIRLIQMITVTSLLVLSFAVFAGGAGCKSKDGHGTKDMSAEAMQEFKDNHAWIFSDHADSDKSTPGHDQADKSGNSDNVKVDKLVEI